MTEYVPGLKPQEEEGQSGGRRSRKEGRTQVAEPQSRARLRPSATPGNYYNRPAQPKKDRKSDQLVAALSQVSDVSDKLGQYMYEKQQKEAELQAKQEIQSMSLEDAGEKVRNGEMGKYDNPYFQDAFQRQFGIRLGLHKGREMKAKFEEGFDPRNDNIDEFIAGHLDPEMQKMADNPVIQEAFVGTIDKDVQKLRTADYSQKAAAIEQDSLDGAYETMTAQIEKRLGDASTPEERQQAIDEGYQAIRDGYKERKELLGLSNSEQDVLTLQVAAKFARNGDVDVVKKLLTDDRGGVGAIINVRGDKGAKAAEVMNAAERNAHDDNKEETFDRRIEFLHQAEDGELNEDELRQFWEEKPGAMSEGHYRSLLRANRSAQEAHSQRLEEERVARRIDEERQEGKNDILSEGLTALRQGTTHRLKGVPLLKENGEGYEMVKPEERKEDLHGIIQNHILPRYAQQFDEETRGFETLQAEVSIYSRNSGVVNEKWENTFHNVGSALNRMDVMDGEVPPKIKDAFALYQNMKTIAPKMLNEQYISASDKDVMEAIRYGVQYDGLELDQAVQKAYQMTQIDKDDNRFSTPQFREMENELAVLDTGHENDNYVTAELSSLARNQARAGGTSDLKTVRERFEEEHETINGWAVPIRGKNVPEGFKGMAEEKIQAYAEEHRTELDDKGLDADDLTLFPMGGMGSTNAWAIVEKHSASPVNDRLESQFTISELQEDIEDRRGAAAAEAAQGRDGGFEYSGPQQRDRLNPTAGLGEPFNEEKPDPADLSNIDPSQGDPSEEVDGEFRNEYKPAREAYHEADLPEDENPQVKKVVQIAREEGWTRQDFKDYLKNKFKTEGTSGQNIVMNPKYRSRILYYLPPS